LRLSPIAAFAAAGLALAAPGSSHAEVTRPLEATIDARGEVGVENLAGAMRVVAVKGTQVTVRATVHAESQEIADSVRLETVEDHGVPTLRVRYPDVDEIRYPAGEGHHSETRYDGRRYRISRRDGTLLYVDVEVGLPADVHARVQNHIGRLEASGVSGSLVFDTASGDILLENVSGTLRADTGSGNVAIAGATGDINCDTGSGDCDVRNVRGSKLSCDTGSGNVIVVDAEVDRLQADTGSGDIRLDGIDAGRVSADTGSGDVELGTRGARLESVQADTGSGDVTLSLPAASGFEARFDMASGKAISRFDDAEPILRRRKVVGYRRGDGRIRIDVDTGSGDVVLESAGGR
jgi:hypothetical protein